jgi:hypothetical protein
MACPYFYPTALLGNNSSVAPRLPLGDAYRGECRAASAAFEPDETRTRRTCNVGYARARCERFPPDTRADAVRFHVSEDSGERIRIQYIFEQDCWPGQHGVLDYSVRERKFSGSLDNGILQTQAGAFLEGYLRRRDESNSKAAAAD